MKTYSSYISVNELKFNWRNRKLTLAQLLVAQYATPLQNECEKEEEMFDENDRKLFVKKGSPLRKINVEQIERPYLRKTKLISGMPEWINEIPTVRCHG